MKTFGHTVAIIIAGPDAVEDRQVAEKFASNRLAGNMLETFRYLHALGYDIDADSIDDIYEESDKQVVMGWTVEAKQSRNLLQRLVWAAKLR